jgi:putative ABC transport system permease protein
LGVLLGASSAWAVSELTRWPTLISWPSAVIALVFSGVLGMFVGIYPSSRAAALEPIQALRAE